MWRTYWLAAISLFVAVATLSGGQSTALAASAPHILASGDQGDILIDGPLNQIVLQPIAQGGRDVDAAFDKFDGWPLGNSSGLAVMNYVDRAGRLQRVYLGSDRPNGFSCPYSRRTCGEALGLPGTRISAR